MSAPSDPAQSLNTQAMLLDFQQQLSLMQAQSAVAFKQASDQLLNSLRNPTLPTAIMDEQTVLTAMRKDQTFAAETVAKAKAILAASASSSKP